MYKFCLNFLIGYVNIVCPDVCLRLGISCVSLVALRRPWDICYSGPVSIGSLGSLGPMNLLEMSSRSHQILKDNLHDD